MTTQQQPQRTAAAYEAEVEARCREGIPLGAYASNDGVHYLFLEPDGPLALTRALPRGRALRAFSNVRPLLAWDEREMSDERAVRFADLPDLRPFRMHDGRMPQAVVAHGAGLMHFVVGPVHAGIIEPGRFTFSSGGETVVHLDAQLGYSHRGVERALEGLPALEAARRVARICGSCSAARSYAYALALERLAGIELAPEVELVRLIVCEFERVYNHIADLAASASAAGWAPGFVNGMALKERAMRLCEAAGGHRLLFDAIVPGGVGDGVFRQPAQLGADLSALAKDVEKYLATLFGNGSVVSRWQRTGVVSQEVARAFGAVGPAHRASRGTVDVRTFSPYGVYGRFALHVPAEVSGDAFARCSVKRDELRESLRLCEFALSLLGRARPPAAERAFPIPCGRTLATVEGARGAETLAVHVDEQGRLERLHAISASYRNWPVVARAMDGNIVPDFPLVNKSFNLCYACVDR